MQKIIIHIGLHKTATTFLQNSVWNKAQGYTLLTRPFTQHSTAFNKLQFADGTLYDENDVKDELKALADKNIILSDEAFSGKPIYFSYINRTMIARRLHSLYPQAELVIFLRDQRDIIESHYSSYIRMPFGTKKIDEFFRKPTKGQTYEQYRSQPDYWDASQLYYDTNDFNMHLDCFKYSHLVNLYKSTFEKCHFFLYEDLISQPEDVYTRLSTILQTSINGDGLRRQNQALNATALERQRRENRLLAPLENRYIKKCMKILNGIVPVSTHDDIKMTVKNLVGDYYKQDNLKLKKQLKDQNWSIHSDKYS